MQACLGNVVTQVSADYLFIENAFCKICLLCHMSVQCPAENMIMKKKYMVLPKNSGNLNRVPEPVVVSAARCGYQYTL